MTEEQLADLMAGLPEEIHFVGGPYCGFFLHPQLECLHDVQTESGSDMPLEYRPASWSPIALNALVVHGPFGSQLYVMESESHWRYRPFWGDIQVPDL